MKPSILTFLAMSGQTENHPILQQQQQKMQQQQQQEQLPILRGVVFDMDGTLTKPNLDFNLMYQRCGIIMDPSLDILKEMENNMSPEQRTRANEIIEEMEEQGRKTLQLMPGTMETIQWLLAHQIPMALVTRNTSRSANVLIKKLQQQQLPSTTIHTTTEQQQQQQPCGEIFQKVIARDDSSGYPPKPDPTALKVIAQEVWKVALPSQSIVMVGDSLSNDVGFGKNSGVTTVLLDTDGQYNNNNNNNKSSSSASLLSPDMVVNHLGVLPSQLWSRFHIESPLGTTTAGTTTTTTTNNNNLHGQATPEPTTKLTKAAANGDVDQVQAILFENNNDDSNVTLVNETDEYGNTALIWAAERGHLEVVKLLLKNNVPGRININVNHRGYLGATAVTRASRRGHVDILEYLLDNGNNNKNNNNNTSEPVQLDIPNNKMQYPLHFAAFKQHPDVVELLLKRGANPWVLDRKGRTPAEDTACPSIRNTILQAQMKYYQ